MFTRPKKTCSLVLVYSCGNSLLVTHDVAESILNIIYYLFLGG